MDQKFDIKQKNYPYKCVIFILHCIYEVNYYFFDKITSKFF